MVQDVQAAYKQYLDGLDALFKTPGELREMIESAIKNHTNERASLDKEITQVKARMTKLRTSAETEYSRVGQKLSEADEPIPIKQRPGGGNASINTVQAFDNQKKIAETVLRLISQIDEQKKKDDSAARNTADALMQRKRLAQERLRQEEKERERQKSIELARQEAERKRILEEQRHLQAEREAQRKKLLVYGLIGGAGLLILVIIIFVLFG